MWRALGLVGKFTGAAAGSGGVYLGYKYQTDEGSRRALQVYWQFGWVVCHYRAVEMKHKLLGTSKEDALAEWDCLDQRYAVPTMAKVGELQGMYVKFAQGAAGMTNTLSDAWIREIRKLEDQVPAREFSVVRETIREETGKELEEIFASIDEQPLGSASIGQVHAAVLKDGREVCVKVQYPDSQDLFQRDMGTIRGFLTIADPGQLFMLEALEKQQKIELDYTLEAQSLKRCAVNMERHGLMPAEVVIPKPLEGLSTKRMLVMELLPGPKLLDGLKKYGKKHAEAMGKTLEELEQEMKAKIESGQMPGRYDGPSAAAIAAYLRWHRFLDAIRNVAVWLYNFCAPASWGRKEYWKTELPPNAPRLMDTIMRVHGLQLLADGVFNSDPHGGNLLMLPDDRVGLIDYGATKEFTYKERLNVCVLFVSLARRDAKMLQDMCEVGGYKSKYGKKEVILKLTQFGYDSWGKEITGGKNIIQFVDELKAEDPWEEVPDNFVMAQMMTVRLRTVALSMNHPITVSDYWGPIAEKILVQEGHPYESWDRAKLQALKPDGKIQVNRW